MSPLFPDCLGQPSAAFGSLSDIKILDLTQMLAGPYGTMILGDHGAQVIKVEGPDGDITRSAGPYREGDKVQALGGYFQSVDRNKRSICLDLKAEEGAKFTAGRMGEYTIEKDATRGKGLRILMGGFSIYDKGNVEAAAK